MTSRLADRLRGIVGSGPATAGSYEDVCGPSDNGRRVSLQPNRNDEAIAEILGGEWHLSRGQRYIVVDRSYAPGYRHGRVAIMDCMPGPDGTWPRLALLFGGAETAAPHRVLFVDLETTGLAGGAGTYAFLVGCAWFDAAILRIRQFFLATFAAEAALLDGVAQVGDSATALVSYNGKSFDLPLIETRFLYHRMEPPFAGLPHLDMLHPARRLWRPDEDIGRGTQASCRLSVLERTLCGVPRECDVFGFEIPARYFSYVRSGDARPLQAVLEHNRLDLISLAWLTARAAQLLEEGPEAARTAREALGLGRLYERAGMIDDACASYARAADLPADVLTRAEALRLYAMSCRRQRRHADAARAWEHILALHHCPGHIAREATEALAIHHEHRLRDLRAARVFALQSLGFTASVSRRHAVHHRLARLDRKLSAAPRESLFS